MYSSSLVAIFDSSSVDNSEEFFIPDLNFILRKEFDY